MVFAFSLLFLGCLHGDELGINFYHLFLFFLFFFHDHLSFLFGCTFINHREIERDETWRVFLLGDCFVGSHHAGHLDQRVLIGSGHKMFDPSLDFLQYVS